MKEVSSFSNCIDEQRIEGFSGWISVPEGGNLLSISVQAVRKNCKAGKYVTKMIDGNGGKQYRILLSSLPVFAQERWLRQHGIADQVEPAEKENDGVKSFDEMPEQAAEKARLRYDVVRLYEEALSSAGHGRKMAAKEAFVERFNRGEWPHLLEKIGPVAWKTIDTHWIPKLRESGMRPSSLAPRYRYTRTGKSVTGISALQAGIILDHYANPNKLKISEIIRKTNKKLRQLGYEKVSEHRVRRFLREYAADHGAEVTMMRDGMKAYKDKAAPFITRDPDKILPADIVEADGHVLNFAVQDPVRRKNRRMTLIMHLDRKTKVIAGWEIMPTESTRAIASSLRRAMLWMGFLLTGDEQTALVPRVMHIDNGKAFRSRYFHGLGDVSLREAGVAGLFDELHSYGFRGVQFAQPYHGQSKTIERLFGNFAELERSVSSYTGTSISYKPARLMRGEFLHRDLAELLQANIVPTIEEAHYLVALWVHEYHQRAQKQSKYLRGMTPYEALEKGFEALRKQDDLQARLISRTELRFLMMQEVTRSLKRNGIRLFNRWFLSPELHDLAKGERELVVRYDLDSMDSVAVYHPNGEFLCVAPEWCPNGGMHGAARLLGSKEDQEAFEAAARQQAMLRNGIAKSVRKSVTAAAESGLAGFVSREVAPDVARLRAAADDELKREKKQRTGTDGMEIPAEWVIPEPEERQQDDDLPHYLDCQNEGY